MTTPVSSTAQGAVATALHAPHADAPKKDKKHVESAYPLEVCAIAVQ
jgi:hypothetical protein